MQCSWQFAHAWQMAIANNCREKYSQDFTVNDWEYKWPIIYVNVPVVQLATHCHGLNRKKHRMKIITIMAVWSFNWSSIIASGPQQPTMMWFDVLHSTGFSKNKLAQEKSASNLLSCAAICGKVVLSTNSNFSIFVQAHIVVHFFNCIPT